MRGHVEGRSEPQERHEEIEAFHVSTVDAKALERNH